MTLPEGFTAETRLVASYDHRDDGRGARGFSLLLVLRGPLGAITCRINTGWMLRPLANSDDWRQAVAQGRPPQRMPQPGLDFGNGHRSGPSGGAVYSHLPVLDPRRTWLSGPGPCDVLPGHTECWGDAGYLVADEVLDAMIGGGDEAAFAKLHEFYVHWIEEPPYTDEETA